MMTVRCPNCDAAYQLDETKFPQGGRKLKCAKCQTVWVAQAPQPMAEEPAPAEPDVPKVDAAAHSAPEPDPLPPEGEAAFVPDAGEMLVQRTPGVESVVKVGGWRQWVRGDNLWRSGALALIALGVLAGAGVVAVRWWPHGGDKAATPVAVAGAAAHEAGVAVVQPPEGVVLHRVRGEVTELDGDNAGVALTVRGLLTNTTSETVVVPPMRLELLGTNGKVADLWPVSGVDGTLEPHAEQAWTVSLSAPDMSAVKGWRVVFVKSDAKHENTGVPEQAE